MGVINCRNGSFNIDKKQLSFLRLYKSVEETGDVQSIYGYDTIHTSLGYKNINLFLNFLNDPNDTLLGSVEVDYIDNMVDEIKTFIDVSCEYALNEGEIEERLYRYEDIRNIDNYKKGELASLKSTSNKPNTIKFTFEKNGTVPLLFKAPSFCPYIKLDDILQWNQFSNESEYLLSPYVNCTLTDEYEYDRFHIDSYRIVHIDNNYLDADPDKMADTYHEYNKYKDYYAKLYNRDKDNGIVSDELKTATRALNDYLRQYARCQYLKYNELYKRKYTEDRAETITSWPEEYKGIGAAIKKYATNDDPNKNWAAVNEFSVYALNYLINSNFISSEKVNEIYNSKDQSSLDKFLKERASDSVYNSLSEVEFQEFLRLFNVSAGYGKVKPTKEEMIEATNKLACLDFIVQSNDYHR